MLEQWLHTSMQVLPPSADRSFQLYVSGRALLAQGKTNEAIMALVESAEQDPSYLHPLFELAKIYIRSGLTDSAEVIVSQLRRANEGNAHPRDREINQLSAAIEAMKDAPR
jgi:lipopolysaccharide biosynthesis regulator YciM